MTTKTRPVRKTKREAMADWINKGLRPNVALTFTLFKARRHRGPNSWGWERGERDTYSRTYDQFIRRLSREVYGATIYKRHRKLIPNGAAIEGDGSHKRYHLHCSLRLPEWMLSDEEFPKFVELCRSVWRQSPWAMPDWIIEPIAGDWVAYSLKDGPEALLTGTLSF